MMATTSSGSFATAMVSFAWFGGRGVQTAASWFPVSIQTTSRIQALPPSHGMRLNHSRTGSAASPPNSSTAARGDEERAFSSQGGWPTRLAGKGFTPDRPEAITTRIADTATYDPFPAVSRTSTRSASGPPRSRSGARRRSVSGSFARVLGCRFRHQTTVSQPAFLETLSPTRQRRGASDPERLSARARRRSRT